MTSSPSHPTKSTTRIISSDLVHHIDEVVALRGWLYKVRKMGGLAFVVLRDRGGLVQMVIDKKDEMDKLEGLYNGTVMRVEGKVKAEPRAPGGVELFDTQITVEVPVAHVPPVEVDKKFEHKPETLETLFDHKVVMLRNMREQAIFRIQAEVKEGLRRYLKSQDFVEFNSPKLLPGATEGGAEVFKLDYFGQEATLAQSAQFYKQIMVGVFERAFEINPTYRAEPSATTRHMTEFMHIDAEMGFVEFEELLQLVATMVNSTVEYTWASTSEELGVWQAKKPVLPASYPALSLEKIHALYSEKNPDDTRGEKDLRPDEERFICEYSAKHLGSEAVFVVDWPRDGAKFYHRHKADDPNTFERFDLLFRGVEIATGSMREHRYDKLCEQLKTMAGGDPDSEGFKHYMSAFKYGMPPHGGFGMGLERLTQKIIGLSNVKEASLFPRDMNRLSP